MKNKLLLLLITMLVMSCSSIIPGHSVYFNLGLISAKLNGEEVPEYITGMSFEDDVIKIDFVRNPKLISFDLFNKTDRAVEIIWDKSCLVNTYGNVEKIMHKGVKLTDREESQKPSIIPSKATHSDIITVVDAVTYNRNYGWNYKYLFTWAFKDRKDADVTAEEQSGKTTRILLYLQQGNEFFEYEFEFELNDPIQGYNINANKVGQKNQPKAKKQVYKNEFY